MKRKVQNVKCKTTVQKSKLLSFALSLYALIFTLFALPIPVYAEVNIRDKFGYGDIGSLGEAISKFVMPVFSIAASLVVIYFLWGAFNYIKSGGNKEEIAGARGMITHAIIGFIILMFAFLILQFLLSSLFGISGLLF